MLKLSTLILTVCVIIRQAHGQALPEEKIGQCKQQTTYNASNLDSVEVALYYDVDPAIVDFNYVKAMCKARDTITKATFKFYPGVSTKVNKKNEVECYHTDKNNTDCTDSFAAACASQLSQDFAGVVCCVCGGKAMRDCFKDQNPNAVDKFDQCTQFKDESIKPDQILLQNVNAAKQAYPPYKCFPIMTFHGSIDPCARYMFFDYPVETICAMLKANADTGCPKTQK